MSAVVGQPADEQVRGDGPGLASYLRIESAAFRQGCSASFGAACVHTGGGVVRSRLRSTPSPGLVVALLHLPTEPRRRVGRRGSSLVDLLARAGTAFI